MRNKILPEQIAFIHYINYMNNTNLSDGDLLNEYCEKLSKVNTQPQYIELSSDTKYKGIIKYGDIEFEFSYFRYDGSTFLVLYEDEIEEYLQTEIDEILENAIDKLPETLRPYFNAQIPIDLKKINPAEIFAPYTKQEVVYIYKDTTVHIYKID